MLLELLAPLVGDKLAIEATILSRLVSMVAEGVLSAGLYAIGPGKESSASDGA